MRKEDIYSNLPDLLVVLLQTAGDSPFEKLIELSEPITYSLVRRYFFPDYENDDFVQEARSVLVKSVRGWEFDKGMPFLQYYHMQLANHLNMLVRKNHAQKRKVNLETSSLDSLVEESGIHIQGTSRIWTNPEEATIALETYDKYLLDLSPLESKVFHLFIAGKPYEEISTESSVTIDQVRSALYRCRVKLLDLMNRN